MKTAFLAGACLLVLVVLKVFDRQAYLLEERLGALGWVLFSEQQPEQRLTIVAIDERSLAQIGPWPWSRDLMAALVDKLDQYGAELQLYDVVFPESKPGDQALNRSLEASGAIIGQIPILNADGKGTRTGLLTGSLSSNCLAGLPQATGFLANTSAFSAVPSGHITPVIDSDGVVRKQPPLICFEGGMYPSLSVRAWLQSLGGDHQRWNGLAVESGNGPFEAEQYLVLGSAGNARLPLDEQGNVRLSYERAPQSYHVVSALDVLNGTADAELLQNRWVLVGATAFGLGDIVPTPYSGSVAGVELQGRLLSAMLDGDVPFTPRNAEIILALEMLLFAAIIVALASFGNRITMVGLPVASVLLPILGWLVHVQLLQVNVWLGWLPPALFGCFGAIALALYEHARMRTERQRVYANFSSYMPLRAAQDIAFNLPSGSIEAERKEMVLLCADLRNFSSFEARHAPEEAAALLHLFFVLAGEIVQKHGGLIEEFKGDSVLVSWEVDTKQNVASNALLAAKELMAVMEERLPEELALGIAIEKGPVLVGSIGPAYRRSNAFLGDTVTLTLRMQEMTQELAQPILIGEYAARELKGQGLESQGSFLLAGTTMPHILFALPMEDEDDVDDFINGQDLDRHGLRVISGGRSEGSPS